MFLLNKKRDRDRRECARLRSKNGKRFKSREIRRVGRRFIPD